jgi:hypothetical protein
MKRKKTATKPIRAPEELVAAYAKEAAPLERRGHRGPEQLPAGAEIMKLDTAGKVLAVVACYAEIEAQASRSFGTRIMLGLLATTLLRSKLPLTEGQLRIMTEHASRSRGPAWGPCDWDWALVKTLARLPGAPNRQFKDAIQALTERRGTGYAIDRKIAAECKKLLDRR